MLGLIDESTPSSTRGVHYVIGAAVLLDPWLRGDARLRALKLVGGRARPFHWKDEGPEKRTGMIELLADLGVVAFAVVHEAVAGQRQARARSRALAELVTLLGHEGVTELVIESRGVQDREDRHTLLATQGTGRVPSHLTYAFAGKDDPLVWLPDSIAGIVSEVETGRDPRWLTALQEAVGILDVRRLPVA